MEFILGGKNHCYYHPSDSPMKVFSRAEIIFNPSYYNNDVSNHSDSILYPSFIIVALARIARTLELCSTQLLYI